MLKLLHHIKDFGALIFPEVCYACGAALVQHEKHICITCLHQLPYTNFHLDHENRLAKQFWGRVNIASAVAFLYFNKAGRVQNLMHQLKYNNQPQIGVELGRMYGKNLKGMPQYSAIEAIVPVPLHPKKFLKRGYNQSEQFAIGLAEVLEVPVSCALLTREVHKESQTSKSRKNRFDNMETVFKAHQQEKPIKTVLLVDDTITTGATLEACALALQEVGVAEINIVGIAFTE
jgi:ComF family protein